MNIPTEVANYFAEGKKRLISITPHSDFELILKFDDGSTRLYKLKNKLTGVLSALLNVNKFNQVFIDENGNIAWDIDDNIDSSVVWSNRIDLCADNAYIYSIKL